MNPFESGTRKVIPAVLIYARNRERVLMIHRNGRPGDYHSGKWNGLGGKAECDESPLETALREFGEEAGLVLTPERFLPLGFLTFPNFKANKHEDWNVTVFSAELKDDEAARVVAGDEGELHWVPDGEVSGLNLWAGDRHFIGRVLAREPFIATIWYDGQDVKRTWVSGLGK